MFVSPRSRQHLHTVYKSVDEPKRNSGEVASNHEAYENNMQVILNTLKRHGVLFSKNYLRKERFTVSESELEGLEKIIIPHEDSFFTDLRSGEQFLMDKGRLLALAKDITNARGVKTTDFELKKVTAGKLHTKPLEGQDYEKGAPFFLSYKTKHCDFPGAVGGNYPIAEYLSNQGTSVEIFNSSDDYVGHYNIWQQDNGDFCIGTIAMIDNHGYSQFSHKELRQLILTQGISLLQNNERAQRVSIGMGGHNLRNMFPSKFAKNTDGFFTLGELRHADLSSVCQDRINHLERITDYEVRKKSPVITGQDEIGMMPDQRKDFKNALVVVDRNKLEGRTNILENIKQTKNQPSSNATIEEQSVSRKSQRKKAYKNKMNQRALIEELLKNQSIQECECSLVEVNGMHALLRVDNPSNRKQIKQRLQKAQGLQVENGLRYDELRVQLPYVTELSVRDPNRSSGT